MLVPLRPSDVPPTIVANRLSPCRVPSTTAWGPRPITLPSATRNDVAIETPSASVSSSTRRRSSPTTPCSRMAWGRAGQLGVRRGIASSSASNSSPAIGSGFADSRPAMLSRTSRISLRSIAGRQRPAQAIASAMIEAAVEPLASSQPTSLAASRFRSPSPAPG